MAVLASLLSLPGCLLVSFIPDDVTAGIAGSSERAHALLRLAAVPLASFVISMVAAVRVRRSPDLDGTGLALLAALVSLTLLTFAVLLAFAGDLS